MISCYIIDDEPLAREILAAYIAKIPFLELKGSFMSPIEAQLSMKHDLPDVLFLDVNMPDLDGLSFIPMLNPKPLIILTTAYDQFALKAFELEVSDYLLKPFSFERFYKSVLRLYNERVRQPEKREEQSQNKDDEYLFLKVGHRIQKVDVRDILFVEGMKDYLRIHTSTEKIMTLLSFAELEALLPASKFCRVHRSFMVAIDKIDHIEKKRIRIAGQMIPVSDTYAEGFFGRLRGL